MTQTAADGSFVSHPLSLAVSHKCGTFTGRTAVDWVFTSVLLPLFFLADLLQWVSLAIKPYTGKPYTYWWMHAHAASGMELIAVSVVGFLSVFVPLPGVEVLCLLEWLLCNQSPLRDTKMTDCLIHLSDLTDFSCPGTLRRNVGFLLSRELVFSSVSARIIISSKLQSDKIFLRWHEPELTS